jgi:CPA2 family monovalent cation:H+ antiporter-2
MLFQDIAVIPSAPLLSSVNLELSNDAPQSLITGYQSLQTVIVFGFLRQSILQVFCLFRCYKSLQNRLQELFTTSALLLVVGVSI